MEKVYPKPKEPRLQPLRRWRSRLILLLVVYFFAGTASQKVVPGVDEIFPFFGWSLFSKVPDEGSHYTVLIYRQDGRKVDPPAPFLVAPDALVTGNRYIARKVIQRLGGAYDQGKGEEVEALRRLLEQNHLVGRKVRYELIQERYQPLEMWRTGESRERRVLTVFVKGGAP
jgi:hypothetical protein